MTPIISVVIPAFNAERFLLQTVESVLSQTLREIEVIIVDDGSTDATLHLARSIDDPRVRVVSQANQGEGGARNHGLAVSSEETQFVAFLDSDDIWDRGKAEAQVHYLERHPATVAVGAFMRYISTEGRPLGKTGQVVSREDRQKVAQALLLPYPISSCLMRKTIVRQLGGFDTDIRDAADLELYARLAQAGELGCIPKALGSYRVHPDSLSTRKRVRMSRNVRFVQQRAAARRAGGELTWEEFDRTYQPAWAEKYHDLVGAWYRSAGLWQLEGKPARAAFFALLAGVANPRYTLPRLYHQLIAR